MITAIVNFKLPAPMTLAQTEGLFNGSAHKYKGLPGLERKYYLLSEDGSSAGGVYLWRTRQDAERLYSDEWRRFIRERYGCNPVVSYFESPVIVDNAQAL